MLPKKIKTQIAFSVLFFCSFITNAQIKPTINTAPTGKPNMSAVKKIIPIDKVALQAARQKIENPQWTYTLSTVQLAEAPVTMAFAKNRPTVTILIHGVTGFPTDERDNRVGNLYGARNYWGFDFVDKLLGSTEVFPTTFTDANQTSGALKKENWETKFINGKAASNHFITTYVDPKLTNIDYYTPFSVMLTYRDGSLSFKKQVAATSAQIVSLYNSQFGSWPEEKKPQLILLCHSFGGVVARAICSMPNNIPSNKSSVRAESFTATEKANMDFIRNRTLHITTLSTPHEGSPITKNAEIGSLLQEIKFFGLAPFDEIDKSDPDTDILRQLTTEYMEYMNETILKPELCKRGDGTLIPIHTLGGRVPSGPEYFDNPNQNDSDGKTIDGGIGRTNVSELNSSESNREPLEAYSLLRVDYVMHLFGGDKPWGATPTDNRELDIIKVTDVDALSGCLKYPLDYNLYNFGANPRVYYLRTSWNDIASDIPFRCTYRFTKGSGTVRDGEIDNDGFVGINSSLGVKLGTNTKNYFDHSKGWSAGNVSAGSWYRFYRSIADFHNHGSIKFSGEIAQWLRENIIGNTPMTLYVGSLNPSKAAGPKAAITGTVSIW